MTSWTRRRASLIVRANDALDEERIETLLAKGVESIRMLFVNDLNRGAYLSDTLRLDPTTTKLEALVEIYRMMRPGEPPTKDAAEQLFDESLLQSRALRSFRGRADEVQSPSRPRGHTGLGVLTQGRHPGCHQELIEIRNGRGRPMTSTIWATAACAASAKWRRTHFASDWCAWNAPCASASRSPNPKD